MSESAASPAGDAARAAAPDYAAVIVCGGRSRRFGGEDKALAPLGGRPFLLRVIEAARALTEEIVLACGPAPRYAEFGWPLALDAPPAGGGPLAGVAAGLAAVRAEHVFVLAADQPLVTPEALRTLAAALEGHDAVIPEAAGEIQPLVALYRRAPALAAAQAFLAAGGRAPRALAGALRARVLPVGPPAPGDALALALVNVNTDEDHRRAEEFARSGLNSQG